MTENVTASLAALFAALMVGSVVRCVLLGAEAPEKRARKLGSLLVWWVLAGLTALVCYFGRPAAVLVLGALSLLGLREYLTMTRFTRRHHVADLFAYLAIALHYLFIALEWPFWSSVFLPIFVFLMLPTRLVLKGQTAGFVHDVSTLFFGVMLVGYCLSHGAMLFLLPPEMNRAGGLAGWFVFLVVLTELNDIAQALWGRQFGRHKVTPNVSPNKTWEGLLLGMGTTIVVALLLAPRLTPLTELPLMDARVPEMPVPMVWALLAGLIIAVGGFFGDLTMSAVKRDVGVKDSGTLLPGQGGILDRVDSLSFTAPLFCYYVRFLFGE